MHQCAEMPDQWVDRWAPRRPCKLRPTWLALEAPPQHLAAIVGAMASNPNNLGAPTAAQRLQGSSPGAALKPSSSRGYLLPDNGQECQVQAIDFQLSSCA